MRRRPTEEEIDRVVRLLADFGWPASRGWVRSLVEVEASGNVGNLVAAVRELGEDRDFFVQCRLDRKDARYVLGALRRVLKEVEDQERFRAGYTVAIEEGCQAAAGPQTAAPPSGGVVVQFPERRGRPESAAG